MQEGQLPAAPPPRPQSRTRSCRPSETRLPPGLGACRRTHMRGSSARSLGGAPQQQQELHAGSDANSASWKTGWLCGRPWVEAGAALSVVRSPNVFEHVVKTRARAGAPGEGSERRACGAAGTCDVWERAESPRASVGGARSCRTRGEAPGTRAAGADLRERRPRRGRAPAAAWMAGPQPRAWMLGRGFGATAAEQLSASRRTSQSAKRKGADGRDDYYHGNRM